MILIVSFRYWCSFVQQINRKWWWLESVPEVIWETWYLWRFVLFYEIFFVVREQNPKKIQLARLVPAKSSSVKGSGIQWDNFLVLVKCIFLTVFTGRLRLFWKLFCSFVKAAVLAVDFLDLLLLSEPLFPIPYKPPSPYLMQLLSLVQLTQLAQS